MCTNLFHRRILGFVCIAGLAAGSASAEVFRPSELGFRVEPQTYLPDGRFHATLWVQVPTAAHELRIQSVNWTGQFVEVELLAERTDFDSPIPIPSVWVHATALHIENLPPGEYPIVVNDLQIEVRVPGFPDLRDPAPIRLWPEHAALGDPIWLIAEAPYACASSNLTFSAADVERGSARVVVDFVPAACTGAPRLHAIPLGALEPGSYRMAVETTRTSRDGSPNSSISARERTYLTLDVAASHSSRLGGAWYDPAQSGQGITVEFFDDRVLLYWYTFDAEGGPVWLMAEGANAGELSLDAYLVTGGAFPPALDPDRVILEPWGTIQLAFEDCTTGSMSWSTNHPGFAHGESPLVRLTGPAGFRCDRAPAGETLRPDWYQDPATHFRLDDPSG